ncbi:hypothetical protein D3C73_888870 [compost metagenome]
MLTKTPTVSSVSTPTRPPTGVPTQISCCPLYFESRIVKQPSSSMYGVIWWVWQNACSEPLISPVQANGRSEPANCLSGGRRKSVGRSSSS